MSVLLLLRKIDMFVCIQKDTLLPANRKQRASWERSFVQQSIEESVNLLIDLSPFFVKGVLIYAFEKTNSLQFTASLFNSRSFDAPVIHARKISIGNCRSLTWLAFTNSLSNGTAQSIIPKNICTCLANHVILTT